MDYSHTPKDVQKAITDYDNEIQDGELTPWIPAPAHPGALYEYHDEYEGERVTDDPWIADHLRDHLPEMYTE